MNSDLLQDFFKPISSDMDRLKSIKKYRHGRRIRQLERFEHKMKEERLKRIRERQKEFFSEIEAHKYTLYHLIRISHSFNLCLNYPHLLIRIHVSKIEIPSPSSLMPKEGATAGQVNFIRTIN